MQIFPPPQLVIESATHLRVEPVHQLSALSGQQVPRCLTRRYLEMQPRGWSELSLKRTGIGLKLLHSMEQRSHQSMERLPIFKIVGQDRQAVRPHLLQLLQTVRSLSLGRYPSSTREHLMGTACNFAKTAQPLGRIFQL